MDHNKLAQLRKAFKGGSQTTKSKKTQPPPRGSGPRVPSQHHLGPQTTGSGRNGSQTPGGGEFSFGLSLRRDPSEFNKSLTIGQDTNNPRNRMKNPESARQGFAKTKIARPQVTQPLRAPADPRQRPIGLAKHPGGPVRRSANADLGVGRSGTGRGAKAVAGKSSLAGFLKTRVKTSAKGPSRGGNLMPGAHSMKIKESLDPTRRKAGRGPPPGMHRRGGATASMMRARGGRIRGRGGGIRGGGAMYHPYAGMHSLASLYEDSDEGDFICSQEDDEAEWKNDLKRITGYDPSTFKDEDLQEARESSSAMMRKEELISMKLGIQEEQKALLEEEEPDEEYDEYEDDPADLKDFLID